jgi:hypothetical protein
MRARIVADNRITTTTDARIEELIGKAAFYREQYAVPTDSSERPSSTYRPTSSP